MGLKKIHTYFAPAERVSLEVIKNQSIPFSKDDLLTKIINTSPNLILVLNKQRQIVFANNSMLDYLGLNKTDSLYGLRPGEILNCVHAFESEGGCGTTEFCRTCGAVKAILNSQKGKEDVQECRIIKRETFDAYDFRVWTSPLIVAGEQFTVCAVSDISDEKRRKALEKIFFHDILNTAGSIQGFSDLLRDAEPEEIEKFRQILFKLSDKLIEEINAQRELTMAENNELIPNIVTFNSVELMEEIVESYKTHPAAIDRFIKIDKNSTRLNIASDRILLRRVLGNLLKNALEASSKGKTVTLGSYIEYDKIVFWVHNDDYIPRDIQLQLFQRSFSTKGSGRGLGTYSTKLLSERYLKGNVSYTTSSEEGTIFKGTYPLSIHYTNK